MLQKFGKKLNFCGATTTLHSWSPHPTHRTRHLLPHARHDGARAPPTQRLWNTASSPFYCPYDQPEDTTELSIDSCRLSHRLQQWDTELRTHTLKRNQIHQYATKARRHRSRQFFLLLLTTLLLTTLLLLLLGPLHRPQSACCFFPTRGSLAGTEHPMLL